MNLRDKLHRLCVGFAIGLWVAAAFLAIWPKPAFAGTGVNCRLTFWSGCSSNNDCPWRWVNSCIRCGNVCRCDGITINGRLSGYTYAPGPGYVTFSSGPIPMSGDSNSETGSVAGNFGFTLNSAGNSATGISTVYGPGVPVSFTGTYPTSTSFTTTVSGWTYSRLNGSTTH